MWSSSSKSALIPIVYAHLGSLAVRYNKRDCNLSPAKRVLVSAPAGLYNIVADQGSTLSRVIYYKDPAKKPILFTGYTARMQVRSAYTSATVVLELTTENGGIELGATDGSIVLYVSDEVMIGVPEGIYVYDLEVAGPSADIFVYKILQGNFAVRSEVTR